jgi:DNA helicase-2/ATP-dependent DNA helicase PcrA
MLYLFSFLTLYNKIYIKRSDFMEIEIENKYLKNVIRLLEEKIENIGIIDLKKELVFSIKEYTYLSEENRMQEINDNLIRRNLLNTKEKNYKNYIKLLHEPYFARIDFMDYIDDYENYKVYIGLGNLQDDMYNILVHDWRSPIASLFYEYELGKASYESKNGVIEGIIKLKRQYIIKDSKELEYFDTDIEIKDNILKEILCKEVDNKMKGIVKTIQKEQNEVIRASYKNIHINGCSGSGKTSVALHRIAYLLYTGKYKTDEVLIFSPNRLFSKYIENVLPDIGSDTVYQTTFENFICGHIPKTFKIGNINELYEKIYSSSYINSKKNINDEEKFVVNFKLSNKILDYIREYIDYLKDVEYDFFYNNNFSITTKEIQKYIKDVLFNLSLSEVYLGLENYLINSIELNVIEINIKKDEIKKIKNLLKIDIDKIFLAFTKDTKWLTKRKNGTIEEKAVIVNNLYGILDKKLNYEDILIYMYFKKEVLGLNLDYNIKHIVIDEVQEYSTEHLELISYMFPNATFTLVGDKNQHILYKTPYIEGVFDELKSYYFNKNYRSTFEINNFANKLLKNKTESINRNGFEVKLIKSEKSTLHKDIYHYVKKDESTAIIAKNREELYSLMKKFTNNYGFKKYKTKFKFYLNDKYEIKGKFPLLPSYLAKGLEFNNVIIVDGSSYNIENEKNLLYITMTRALHKLTIFYTEEFLLK